MGFKYGKPTMEGPDPVADGTTGRANNSIGKVDGKMGSFDEENDQVMNDQNFSDENEMPEGGNSTRRSQPESFREGDSNEKKSA